MVYKFVELCVCLESIFCICFDEEKQVKKILFIWGLANKTYWILFDNFDKESDYLDFLERSKKTKQTGIIITASEMKVSGILNMTP